MTNYDLNLWLEMHQALSLLLNTHNTFVKTDIPSIVIKMWEDYISEQNIKIKENYTLPMFKLLCLDNTNNQIEDKIPFYAGLSICEHDPNTEDGLRLWKDLFTPHEIISEQDGVTIKQWNMYEQLMQMGSMAAMIYAQLATDTVDKELIEIIKNCMEKFENGQSKNNSDSKD